MKTIGILLASGKSNRLGEPKQLLNWQGGYLINFIIERIMESKLDDLYVVLGYNKKKIEPFIDGEIKIINNFNWKEGKSSSIKAGISKIQYNANAVIFFTVDQPFITSELINKIIDAARKTEKLIIAPSVNNVITIPVLYKEELFDYLFYLEGDEGGKKVINKNKDSLEIIYWKDERLLIDIDTKADYEEAIRIYQQ